MLVDFYGKQIAVKEFDCSLGTLNPERISPFVNLFVKVTNGCNARCLFCSNADAKPTYKTFDIDKLEDIVLKLKEQSIKVNRLNITGGEPSVVSPLVENILQRMDGKVFDDIHLHLNTNGLLPQSQELMRHPRWDSISMSLHHYDIDKLSELYGCKIHEDAFKFEEVNKQKLNVSCNLIKGYIDNPEEAHKMLDFALEHGFHDNNITHVYFTKSMNRGNDCKCSNYLYNKDLKILEIYMRNYANPQYCESSLMFDGEYLRQGFHDNNIIY